MAKRSTKIQLDFLPPLPRDRSPGIGCVGAGFIMADCHLPAYRAHGLNPVAICSARPAHARQIAERHAIAAVYETARDLARDPRVEVVDIAVPPDAQYSVLRDVLKHGKQVRGILAQKPLGVDYAQAKKIVTLCKEAAVTLAVNQNMRFDHSIAACKSALKQGLLGEPVLATIDMRAIPHWMPWQRRMGWVTLRIMSIHHLDAMRFLFGDPARVFASIRPDPRTGKIFKHADGICLYILEYASGLRAGCWDDVWAGPAREGAAEDKSIRWRVEGTTGMARGTIGWPDYPAGSPSTIDLTTTTMKGRWHSPRWKQRWFPDAFIGPMADLLIALERRRQPTLSGADNLKTMALVEACYLSAREHRAVELEEIQ